MSVICAIADSNICLYRTYEELKQANIDWTDEEVILSLYRTYEELKHFFHLYGFKLRIMFVSYL